MSTRSLFRWSLIVIAILMAILAWCAFSTSPASAQCDTPKSSCVSCHGTGNHVTGMGEWNSVHVNQDMCIYCHGGNGNTMDENLAHEGIVAQPLSNIYTDCHSCHPSDYIERSAKFAATLNVTPSSCATPTSIAVSNGSGELPPGGINIPTNPVNATQSQQPFLVIGAMLSILALFLFGLVWLERHQMKSKISKLI
jgi:hypothetical protein